MEIAKILEQVDDLYQKLYPDVRKAIAHLDGQAMMLTDKQNYSDVDLQEKLQYYASWSSYYSFEIERWKFIEEWLLSEYKSRYAQALSDSADKRYVVEASAEAKNGKFKRAAIFAATRKGHAYTNYQAANAQRDIIQNMIRLRIAERRSQPCPS